MLHIQDESDDNNYDNDLMMRLFTVRTQSKIVPFKILSRITKIKIKEMRSEEIQSEN